MKYINTLPNITISKYIHRMSKTTPLEKNNLVVFAVDTEDKLIEYMNDCYNGFSKGKFALGVMKDFYSHKKIVDTITGLTINEIHNQSKIYERIEKEVTFINMKHQGTEIINKKNLIVNSPIVINAFFNKAKMQSDTVVLEIVQKILKHLEIDNYTNKYLVFNLQDISYDMTTMVDIKEYGFKTHKDLYFYIMYLLKNNLDEILYILKDYVLVFHSKVGIVKLDINELKLRLDSGKVKENFLNTLLLRINAIKGKKKTGTDIMNDINMTNNNIKSTEPVLEEFDDVEGKKENIKMNSVIKDMSDDDLNKNTPLIEQFVDAVSDSDKKAVKILDDIKSNMIDRKKIISPKEDEYLKNMKTLSINEKDIDEVLADMKNMTIPEETLEHVSSISPINTMRFKNFNNMYVKNLREPHLKMAGKHFAKCSVPLYMTSNLVVEDTSDDLSYKDTVKYVFKDDKGVQFKVSLDVPKLTKNGFVYLNGQKSVLTKQLYSLPITKVKDDVIITATYNKVFMSYRGGKYLTPNQSRLMRALDSIDKTIATGITFGDKSEINARSSKATSEYIAVSKLITAIDTNNIDFTFDIEESIKRYGDHSKEGYLILGTYKDTEIKVSLVDDTVKGDDTIDGMHLIEAILKLCELDAPEVFKSLNSISTDTDSENNLSISELLVTLSKSEAEELYNSLERIKTVPTTLAGSHVKMMDRWLPLILVLAHTHGFYTVLERAKIKSNITYKIAIKEDNDGIRKKPKYNKYKQMMIETADAFIIFDLNSLENIALLAPLTKVDLQTYNASALESHNFTSVLLESYSGQANLPVYVDVFKDVLIDPLAKEALLDYDLPTDFLDVMLYANMLLASGKHNSDIDFNTKKLRHAEILSALAYNALADAYSEYAIKKKRGSRTVEFSVDRNAVMKSLFSLNTISPYNSENPIEEQSALSECSFRGLRGVNLDQAFNLEKRSYDTTHYGIVGLPSNYGPGVGVSKYLTAEPAVLSPKGYFKTIDNLEDVDKMDINQYMTTIELLNPCITKRDDAQRVAMAYGQSAQIVPVIGATPNLITYGYDEALANLSEDFAFSASDDGEVISSDGNFLAVKYKNGETEVFKMNRVERNAAKSFYTVNEVVPVDRVRTGYKFKKNEVLAYNKYFFKSSNNLKKTVFSDAPEALVVVHSMPETFEDSTVLSESFAESIGTFITNNEQVKLSKEYTVNEYARIGSIVKAGTTLFSFNKATDDDFINSLLSADSESTLNRIVKKSPHAGEIVGIRIYYTNSLDDMSDSLRDFINSVTKVLEPKERALKLYGSKYDKIVNSEVPLRVPVGTKKNGHKLESGDILVEYFIKSFNIASTGNKVTYQAALKCIAARILPDNMMPYCEQSGRRADCILRTVSVGARKVYSVPVLGVGTKGLRKIGNDLSSLFDDINV